MHHTQTKAFAKMKVTPILNDDGSLSIGDARYPTAKAALAALVTKPNGAAKPKAAKAKKAKAPKVAKGNVISARFVPEYTPENGCGDDMHLALRDYFSSVPAGGDPSEVEFDRDRFAKMARAHDCWQPSYDSLNNGMVRMNVGNRLRAVIRRGGTVKFGSYSFKGKGA